MGFVNWPIRCLECQRRLALEPGMVYGTCVRCPKCQTLVFVVVFHQIELAFVAELQSREWRDMASRGLSPRDVMRELGAMRRAA